MTPDPLPFDQQIRDLPDLPMELATAGRPGDPLVILLHGFPDLWPGCCHQIAGLAAAGFRVLAPNPRGYGRSDKPEGGAAYDVDRLAADVTALADSEGAATFHPGGHDWGGLVAWWVSPSPNLDNGYDVSDDYAIDPRYGSLGDFVEVMNRAQALGLRVIVDLIVSHT